MVPGLVGGNDDVQRWTAELMAKGRPRFCPGAAAGRDRSGGGGRQAPVEDGDVDGAAQKFVEGVSGVRHSEGRERDQTGGRRSSPGRPDFEERRRRQCGLRRGNPAAWGRLRG